VGTTALSLQNLRQDIQSAEWPDPAGLHHKLKWTTYANYLSRGL